MNILYLLVPLALLLAGSGVYGFFWAVRSGQFDDVETPALRVLMDDTLDLPLRSEDAAEQAAPERSNPDDACI